MRQLETYSYTIPAGETINLPAANDNFIILASTGTVTVRGDTFGTLKNLIAGQGLKSIPFNRLELINTSGAPNTVVILLTPAEFVNQVFSGSVDLVANSLNVITRPLLPAAQYVVSGALLANTAVSVFLAAANTNGAIIHAAAANDTQATVGVLALLAKATAPANVADGEVIAQSAVYPGSASNYLTLDLKNPTRIAAGLGLWFIGSVNGLTPSLRSVRYTLL